jgi:replication factor A1
MKNLNQKKQTVIEYLALLSVKYGVYLAELFQAIVSAREHRKAVCQNLTIEYRGSVKDEAIILITKDNSIVAQFRVTEQFLLRKGICFENWMDTDKIRRQMSKQNPVAHSTLIQNLRHGMKKISIEAEVLETLEPQLVHTQYGNSATVTNAWIADETGKVKLCLWNEQANSITKGDTIQIRGASVNTYNGERQLRIGKTGVVTVLHTHATKTTQPAEAIAENIIYS